MRLRRFFPLFCLLLLLLPISARADMGPKPQVTITVVNAPEEPYCLDLLISDSEGTSYENLRGALPDPALLDSLRMLSVDGWHLAITEGTGIPMSGEIVSADGAYVFGYSVPETFRIACATADHAQSSAPITRTMLQQDYTYDYAANTVQRSGQPWLRYLRQFAYTCGMTLLLEGVLFLLFFGLACPHDWGIFLLTNIATQLFLTATWGRMILSGATDNLFGLLIFLLPICLIEAVIWTAEALVYCKFLRAGTPKRRVAYAITANAVSFFATAVSLSMIFRFAMQ